MFQGPISEFVAGGGGLTRPVFKWAGPSEGAPRRQEPGVAYGPRNGPRGQEVHQARRRRDFCWSLADPILSVYQLEQVAGNQPARWRYRAVSSAIRSKNLFSVSDVRMFWQQSGDYFAVKVDRHTKTKKSTPSGFELSKSRSPLPMEVLELPTRTRRLWRLRGSPLLLPPVIHGDGALTCPSTP